MSGFEHCVWLTLLLLPSLPPPSARPDANAAEKPLFREFMGVNGHTIQFKPQLYASACRAVRDYHPMEWDTGADTSFYAAVSIRSQWSGLGKVYGSWKEAGYETDVCIMFNDRPAKAWKDLAGDALAYGRAFSKAFGPLSSRRLVGSAEVGNEPGNYDDESYRTLFKSMAKGLREGDRKLKIGTCALDHRSERKVLQERGVHPRARRPVRFPQHSYLRPGGEGYPTWRRSYPEDPKARLSSPCRAADRMAEIDTLPARRSG